MEVSFGRCKGNGDTAYGDTAYVSVYLLTIALRNYN